MAARVVQFRLGSYARPYEIRNLDLGTCVQQPKYSCVGHGAPEPPVWRPPGGLKGGLELDGRFPTSALPDRATGLRGHSWTRSWRESAGVPVHGLSILVG